MRSKIKSKAASPTESGALSRKCVKYYSSPAFRVITLLVFALLVFSERTHASPKDCFRVMDRVCAATVRRAVTEYASCFKRSNRCEPPERIYGGRVSEGWDRIAMRQVARVWRHTCHSKIEVKCAGVEWMFGAICPTEPSNGAEATDCLFNQYIIPWMTALNDLTGELDASCRRGIFRQAAFAARDYLRHGRDTWERHGRRAAKYCRDVDPDRFVLQDGSLWSAIRDSTDDLIFPLRDTTKPWPDTLGFGSTASAGGLVTTVLIGIPATYVVWRRKRRLNSNG